MYLDTHVHLRDFNQKHKETIKHGLEVASDSGVDAIFDMPNTDPPILSREVVVERLRIAREGYDGVLAVHAEKEFLLDPEKWNPRKPMSHCRARPEKAEIESVRDQLHLALQSKFQGKLHITHISSPGAVDLVERARVKLDISCGITPHHFIYDWNQMQDEKGLLWKMNPPCESQPHEKRCFNI